MLEFQVLAQLMLQRSILRKRKVWLKKKMQVIREKENQRAEDSNFYSLAQISEALKPPCPMIPPLHRIIHVFLGLN